MSSFVTFISNAADIGSILEITNIVLISLFSAIIAGVVLAIIAGLTRGFFSSTFRMLFMLSLVGVALGFLGPTIDAVKSFDIAAFSEKYNLGLSLFVNITNTETGAAVHVPVTNVFDTLTYSIQAAMHVYEVPGSASEIAQTAWALSSMIIKYVVLFVDMLLIVTLGYTLCWILWHLCFKHIVPLVARKIVKIRWLAALEEVVTYVVVGGLFIAPLTSIVNVANQSWQKVSHDENNELVQNVDKFINLYNDSLFAKTFFNWTVNGEGLTLDAQLIDYVTSTVVDGAEVSFTQTLSALTDIGSLVLNSVVDVNGNNPINMGYLLSEKTLTELFNSINKSQLFTYLLPIVATVAMNIDAVAQVVDPKLVEISDIDWLTEITNVQTVALDIVNSGIIDMFLDENGNPIQKQDATVEEQKAEIKKLINKMLSKESYPYFERIIGSIDQSKLLSRVIPALLMTLSESNPSMADILPKTWEEMASFKWGAELNIVYNSLFRLKTTAPDLIELLVNYGFDYDAGPTPSGVYGPYRAPEDIPANQSEEIITVLTANLDELVSVLIGEFDENGDLVGVDENGYTKVFENGHRIPNRFFTLMDSNLFTYLLPNLLKTVVDSLSSGDNSFIKPETLKDALAQLNSGKQVKNYKCEFGALFTAINEVVKNKSLKDLILNPSETDPMKLLKDNSIVNSLVDLLPVFDRSIIFNGALKPFLIDTVKGQGEAFEKVGLSVDSFNFETKDFTGEIAHLLKAMPTITYFMDLMDKGLEGSALFSEIANNVDKIALLLDVVFESDIFNPQDKFFDGDRENNFFTVLQTIFGAPGKDGMVEGMQFDPNDLSLDKNNKPISVTKGVHEWTNTKNDDGSFIKDAWGRPIFDGETGYIANIIANLGVTSNVSDSECKGYTLFDAFTSKIPGVTTTDAIGYLESDFHISKVFASIDDSTLFSTMFGPFLDSMLDDPSMGLVDHSQQQGFSYVTSWTREGQNFAKVCNSIKNANIDLANLNISEFNADTMPHLNQLLHSLADSQMFGDEERFTFNAFLYDKLEDVMSGDNDMLKDAFTGTTTVPATHNNAMQDFGVKQIQVTENNTTVDKIVNDPTTASGSKGAWVNDAWLAAYSNLDKAALENAAKTDPNFYDGDYISSVCKLLVEFSNINEKIDPNSAGGIPDIAGALENKKITSKDLESLLLTMNDVDPFRMVLYNAIDSASSITILEESAGFGKNITLEEMNSEFFITGTKAEKEDEIKRFLEIYDILMDVLDKNKGQDLTNLLSNVNNVVKLKDVITRMNASYLFHLAGYASKDGTPENVYTHTMYQTILESFVMSDAIGQFFYSKESPKDKNATEYSDVDSKKEYYLENIFNVPTVADREKTVKYQQEETSKILEILSALSGGYKNLYDVEIREVVEDGATVEKAFRKGSDTPLVKNVVDGVLQNPNDFYNGIVDKDGKPIVDVTMLDYNQIKGQSVIDIMNCFNNSDLLYDCAPNVLNQIFTAFKTGTTDPNNIFSKALSSANPYYIYNLGGEVNYNARFYREGIDKADRVDAQEFTNIRDIIDIYLELSNKIGENGFADLLNGGLDAELVHNTIEPLLLSVKDTFIMHKADVYKLSDDEKVDPTRKLTSYESMVYGFFDETNIVTMLPGADLAAKQNKIQRTIRELTCEDLDTNDTYGYSRVSKGWDDEIHSLFDFILEISKFSNGDISSFKFDLNNPNFSPDNVQSLLYKFNKIDICDGVLSELFKTVLGPDSSGFNVFSTYNGVDQANYNLKWYEFGIEKPAAGQENEINTLAELLNKLSVKDASGKHTGYVSLTGGDIAQFVEEKGSSDMLLDFVDHSKIYNKMVKTTDIETFVNLKSIFFYNLFETCGLDGFISGIEANDKIRLLNHLMFVITDDSGKRAYDTKNEARALDLLIKKSSIVTDINQFDPSDIDSVKKLITTVNEFIVSLSNSIDAEGNIKPAGRAFISSEILANILQDLIDAQTTNILTYTFEGNVFDRSNLQYFRSGINSVTHQHYKIEQTADNKATWLNDLTVHSYDLLNKHEADGLCTILDLYEPSLVEKPNEYLTKLNRTALAGTVYTGEDGKQHNSYIATIIYLNNIYNLFDKPDKTTGVLNFDLTLLNKAEEGLNVDLNKFVIPEIPEGSPLYNEAFATQRAIVVADLNAAKISLATAKESVAAAKSGMPIIGINDLFIYDGTNGVSLLDHAETIEAFIPKTPKALEDADKFKNDFAKFMADLTKLEQIISGK